jgi:hypothetical protein
MIRGLREIELWLAEVDRRRLGSLPRTSEHFINTFLSTTDYTKSTESNTGIEHRHTSIGPCPPWGRGTSCDSWREWDPNTKKINIFSLIFSCCISDFVFSYI